jgi:UDP-GlcNAc:undecaprenyl-phosphate GlcNAc-1-phosphate transferase
MQARHLGLGLSLISVWAAGRWADHHKHAHLWTVAILAAGALCLAVSGFLVHTFRVGGTIYDLGWLETPATILWMVIISEFFRLFEGLDGLLVGLVIGAIGLMLVYVLPEEEEYARTLCACALPALLGLFPWRVYPARMELRGIGAFLPGFVFGAITLVGREKAFTTKAVILPAFAAIAVFSLLCLWLLEQHLFLPRKKD